MKFSQNQLTSHWQEVKAGADWYFGNTSSIPSSNSADAFLISAWGLYHGFGPITAIRKSRGFYWLVDFKSCHSFEVKVTNPMDHREGVKITKEI